MSNKDLMPSEEILKIVDKTPGYIREEKYIVHAILHYLDSQYLKELKKSE